MMDTARERRNIALICVALAVMTFTVYWPIHTHEFINYDDNLYITENNHVLHGLNWSDIKWAFTTGRTGYAHPLTWITHQLDCQLYGRWAGGHHLTNLAIHIANCVLLFLLFLRMTRGLSETGAIWSSAFVAAVFAIHPLHVESVAWIAERKDVLSALFWMLTLHAYVSYTQEPRPRPYLLALFFFALGLLSKPMIVTLPCVLLLLDYWPLQRTTFGPTPRNSQRAVSVGKLVTEKIPFVLMSLVWSVVTFIIVKNCGIVVEQTHLGIGPRIANAIVSYVTYLWQTFVPQNLAVFYPHVGNLPGRIVLICAVFLVLISVLCFTERNRAPYLLVGWLWYLGILVPVIGVIQAGTQARADRYTYLPQIGLSLAVTWLIGDISKSWQRRQEILGIGAAFILVFWTWSARTQLSYWRDSESLWRHALAVASENEIARYNLGSALGQKGQLDEAMTQLERALQIHPTFSGPHNNLGIVLAKKQRLDEAIAHYEEAIAARPNYASAHYNLATALLRKGDVNGAANHYQKTLEIDPDYAEAHNNLGNLLMQKGQVAGGLSHYEKALVIDPGYTDARNNLAVAFLRIGQPKNAIAQWEKNLELHPNSPAIRVSLAWVLATSPDELLRNGVRALNLAQQARQVSGDNNPIVFRTLAAALAACGRFDEATAAAERGLQLATQQNRSDLVLNLQNELSLYKAKRPLQENR